MKYMYSGKTIKPHASYWDKIFVLNLNSMNCQMQLYIEERKNFDSLVLKENTCKTQWNFGDFQNYFQKEF